MESIILYKIKKLENLITRLIIQEEGIPKLIPTPTQMQILEYLIKHQKENVYQKDLENILNIRRASVSGVLKTMEKNNMIERIIDDKDFRIKKIVLNKNAKKIFVDHEKKIIEIEKLITNNISNKELEIFINIINKMNMNIKKNIK